MAVLGAGVRGSGIAAHCANAGIPVVLLDIVPLKLSDADRAYAGWVLGFQGADRMPGAISRVAAAAQQQPQKK